MKFKYISDKIFKELDDERYNRVYIILKANKIYSICWDNELYKYVCFPLCKIKYIKQTKNIPVYHFFTSDDRKLNFYYTSIDKIKSQLQEIFYEGIKTEKEAKEFFNTVPYLSYLTENIK